MRKLLLLLLILLVFSGGCFIYKDPSIDQLKKAENIDIERMQGSVSSMSVRYYKGNRPETKEKRGQPYYCITLSVQNGSNEIREEFKGVPTHVFDALAIGMKLPQTPLLTLQQLAKMEGRIADKIPFPTDNKFFVVIDDYEKVRLFRLDITAYYHKKLQVDAKLPLMLEEE